MLACGRSTTGVAEDLVGIEAGLVGAHRLELGEECGPTGTLHLLRTILIEVCLDELMANEATNEVELIGKTVLTTTGKVTTKSHEVDNTDEVSLLAMECHVTAVLRRNTCRNHLIIKSLRLTNDTGSTITKHRMLEDVLRNGDIVLDRFRHLGCDAISPTNSTTSELCKADSTDSFHTNLEVEGLLRNRKCSTGKDLLAGLDVLRIRGIVLLIAKRVPGLTVPVPEHLERVLDSRVENGYLDVAEAIRNAHFTSRLLTEFRKS